MKNLKIKLISAFIIGLVIIGGALIIQQTRDSFEVTDQQKRQMEKLNQMNTIVWYYGNIDPEKEITVDYQKVTEFTEDTIGDEEGKYAYHVIVIFDFDGTMDISNEELLLIKDYCENRYYDMLYYGTAHMEQFQQCGFFTKMLGASEGGFTYNGSYWMNKSNTENHMNPYLLLGNWSEGKTQDYGTTDPHWIWKFVISFLNILQDSAYKEQ